MFDAIECMVNYVESNGEGNFSFLLVNDYNAPSELIDARSSYYLISKALPSPMGAFLTAFASENEAESMRKEKGGNVYDWSALKEQLKASGNVRLTENIY